MSQERSIQQGELQSIDEHNDFSESMLEDYSQNRILDKFQQKQEDSLVE